MSAGRLEAKLHAVRRRVSRAVEYYTGVDELRTRYGLIDPVLNALGWDLLDERVVWIEGDVAGLRGGVKKVDYALIGRNGRPAAIVEAKRLGKGKEETYRAWAQMVERNVKASWKRFQNKETMPSVDWQSELMRGQGIVWDSFARRHEMQLSEYVGLTDVKLSVLTDGDEWHIFRCDAGAKPENWERESANVLMTFDVEATARMLWSRLSYQKVLSESPQIAGRN